MLEILDSLIATIAVVMILSLVVQGIEQILKQLFSVKSKYMERELFALFRRQMLPATADTIPSRIKERVTPVAWKLHFLKKEKEGTGRAVEYFKKFFASIGYNDLSLVEKLNGKEFGALVDRFSAYLGEQIEATKESPDSPAGKAVRIIDNETKRLRDNIEHWYDVTLHAFQDHYERRMKMWSYFFSAVVVIALNANVIAIHKEFASSKVLRDAAVATAQQIASRDKSALPGASADPSSPDSLALTRMKKNWKQIDSLVSSQSFPVMRWNAANGDSLRWSDGKNVNLGLAWNDFWSGCARNWFGWLGMIVLVGLGAPFWYDLLRLVVGLKTNVGGKGKSIGGG